MLLKVLKLAAQALAAALALLALFMLLGLFLYPSASDSNLFYLVVAPGFLVSQFIEQTHGLLPHPIRFLLSTTVAAAFWGGAAIGVRVIYVGCGLLIGRVRRALERAGRSN